MTRKSCVVGMRNAKPTWESPFDGQPCRTLPHAKLTIIIWVAMIVLLYLLVELSVRLIDRLRRINQWLLFVEQRNMQNALITPWPYCVTVTQCLIDKPLEFSRAIKKARSEC